MKNKSLPYQKNNINTKSKTIGSSPKDVLDFFVNMLTIYFLGHGDQTNKEIRNRNDYDVITYLSSTFCDGEPNI